MQNIVIANFYHLAICGEFFYWNKEVINYFVPNVMMITKQTHEILFSLKNENLFFIAPNACIFS